MYLVSIRRKSHKKLYRFYWRKSDKKLFSFLSWPQEFWEGKQLHFITLTDWRVSVVWWFPASRHNVLLSLKPLGSRYHICLIYDAVYYGPTWCREVLAAWPIVIVESTESGALKQARVIEVLSSSPLSYECEVFAAFWGRLSLRGIFFYQL